jgi:hypothetical protein
LKTKQRASLAVLGSQAIPTRKLTSPAVATIYGNTVSASKITHVNCIATLVEVENLLVVDEEAVKDDATALKTIWIKR